MTLEDIEQVLQTRLAKLQRWQDEGFEPPRWDEWLAVYNSLIACKQAQANEQIAARLAQANEHLEIIASCLDSDRTPGKLEDISVTLDAIRRHGLSVEKIS